MSGAGATGAHKTRLGPVRKLARLLRAVVDPRAWAHGIKVLNYYNHTHVAELRRVTRGRDVAISPVASFANGQNIVLGDGARIGAHTSLWAGPASGRIVLKENVLIGPSVMITAASYLFNGGSPVTRQPSREADVIIGRDVWIGYGAVILPGTRIGDGAVIGAGAVVRGEVAPLAIMTGNPATASGRRKASALPFVAEPAEPPQ